MGMAAEERYQNAFVRRLEHREGRPWQGVLKYRGIDGSWKQKTRMFDRETVRTRTQANAALAAWKAEEERDALAVDALMPVTEYVNRFIDAREAAGEIEASTVTDYRKSARRMQEAFSALPLRDLDSKAVRAWKDSLVARGLAPSTVTKALRLLHMVCGQAVMDGDLPDNPCQGVKAPSLGSGKRARNALSDASMDRLMAALDGSGPTPFHTAVQLAVRTGMREGEICALRWRDVDLVGGRIHVTHAIGQAGGRFYVKAPKNEGSVRSIAIPHDLMVVLKAHRDAVRGDLAAGGMKKGQRGYEAAFGALYVVGDVEGGFLSPTLLSREWRALATALGIVDTQGRRATFHDLRHTFATVAIAAGEDIAGVSGTLGHSTVSTTLNIYTTARERSKESAMGAVERALREHAPAQVVKFDRDGTQG
ncbi:tyrosine-type recombinase/integrase [Olsenella sp. Marseille-P4559]|uniref:tyrosine-type recombinase/integrase n=1 Tax=Olsenella sp. Marseille-P4559 TaxID=2364795 RepID=UPI0013EF0985|nr:tyrosine-type recombinase/integrase [Olsenella sp. Marseille-P4559]